MLNRTNIQNVRRAQSFLIGSSYFAFEVNDDRTRWWFMVEDDGNRINFVCV